MASQAYRKTTYDVIVVGGGNAGFSAATTAAQEGASVLMVEKAPESDAGGNTYFTAGAYRYCFDSLDDLKPLLYSEDGTKGVAGDVLSKVDIHPYTKVDFLHDLNRVTNGRADPRLAQVLVDGSRDAVQWIADNGGKWHLSFHRQAYEVNGRYKFWGGMGTAFLGGGKALVQWHIGLAKKHNVDVLWATPAVDLYVDDTGNRVQGVEVIQDHQRRKYKALAGVIIACGGFQADPALRAQWLGPAWDLAHVRGCKYSTGDGHRMAAKVGAKTAGHYSGCHSTCWDAQSPRHGGDRKVTNQYTKSGYPLGLMLNVNGERFVDEGADLRNYTYAIFGREVLKQPSGIAFQIWDADGAEWLRKEEYADDVTEVIRANSIEALAEALSQAGLTNRQRFCETIENYNSCVTEFQSESPGVVFDPSIKDGLSTQSSNNKLDLPKSNWALALTKPPFAAVVVTCGITFTFGGLEVVPETTQVVSEATRTPIDGLYCCGELLGGLFYTNYPGGSGLTAGTVFGRLAGKHAAQALSRIVHHASPD